jgi:hypothetical protein
MNYCFLLPQPVCFQTRHNNANVPLKFIATIQDNISIDGEYTVSHHISAGIPAVDL